MKASSGDRRGTHRSARGENGSVAQKPSRAVIPLREKPPHHEFLDRAKGTLPEIISVADLDTLNSALSFLFTFLRKARRQYDEEGDGMAAAEPSQLSPPTGCLSLSSECRWLRVWRCQFFYYRMRLQGSKATVCRQF